MLQKISANMKNVLISDSFNRKQSGIRFEKQGMNLLNKELRHADELVIISLGFFTTYSHNYDP